MYNWLSTAVSRLGTPQHARRLAIHTLKLAAMVAATEPPLVLRRNVMGLPFPSPVGLAAGFDKCGELYPSLPPLGFGFAEIGSVIPLPEPQRSLGLSAVTAILARHPGPHPIPLGVSVSMNRTTPFERMADDYLTSIQAVWQYADYIAINLGGRAGPDLHQPEHRTTLCNVLEAAKGKQENMKAESGLHRPMVVKVNQDRADTNNLLACVRDFCFDGLILGGDTHKGDESLLLANLERALKVLEVPVISVGGIRTPQDAANRLSAGAALVQVYRGIVESGPLLPKRINTHLSALADLPELGQQAA